MPHRLAREPAVAVFAAAVRPLARALYVGGSLASGDYRPGISDVDAVAVVAAAPPDDALTALHRRAGAPKLHCAYLVAGEADDPDREHPYWAVGELWRRPVGGIARAELHAFGITVFGPPPAAFVPPLPPAAVRAAARAELTGFWAGATARPELWLEDLYVDLGLTTLARVRATVTTGRLVTKREAIDDLPALGVPPDLAAEIRARREGRPTPLTEPQRRARAELARRLMVDGSAAVLALPDRES
ncbi:hypothetical protein [Spirilliplanes yamanashiensis]|uniref:Nucleotidyltransferase n=1 Tax=Spirilliplanes yamanashiensis TaxID=42233 RepID=A0A8J3Y7N2_9ACTN|nr:hypothetical protein [Spirilliplanes yamanashiensis]MDP9816919.1 hypothetical protein [Spirilliplanes yamanashiensis]GIJ03426.1 nucleotidyltransferase [Spirilliplanes yamanashiensis]